MFLRIYTIFCMREAVYISYHPRMRTPRPPRPLKRPQQFNCFLACFQCLLLWLALLKNIWAMFTRPVQGPSGHLTPEEFEAFHRYILRVAPTKNLAAICSHGPECTDKSQVHFEKYDHPWLLGAEAVCVRAGCRKPTWNGKPTEYCSKDFRNTP